MCEHKVRTGGARITGISPIPYCTDEKTEVVTISHSQQLVGAQHLSSQFSCSLYTYPGWSSGLSFGCLDGGEGGLFVMGWMVCVVCVGSCGEGRVCELQSSFY